MSGTEKRSATLGDEHSETNRECQDIVDLSKQFPMFSEEPDRLREDLKQSDINSTYLRYLLEFYKLGTIFLTCHLSGLKLTIMGTLSCNH